MLEERTGSMPASCNESLEEVRVTQLLSRKHACDALVLDASARQALMTVRSLGSRGLRVAALGTRDEAHILPAPAFTSRWRHHAVVLPAREGSQEYLAFLERLLDATSAGVLIPSSDGTIALLRQYRQKLEQRTRIALAKEPALRVAVNKELTLEVARGLGISIPRAVSIGQVSDVEAAVHEIGLPAVVKPVESWVGNKQRGVRIASILVTTADEARHAVDVLTGCGGNVLFQQYLSGRNESISFLYAGGRMYARFAQWCKRTYPPLGGTDVLRQSIALPPDSGEQAERLVREIELEGFSHVEFRRDDAGKPYLMEINPRLNASVETAIRAGVDFPYLLYQWAGGGPIDTVQGYKVGFWMRYLWGDIATTAASLMQHGRPGVPSPGRAILDFCTASLIPMKYDYLDWSDPLPAITAIAGRASGGLKRVVRVASRGKMHD